MTAEEVAALATDQTEVTDSVAITIDAENDAPTFELPGEVVNTNGGAGYNQNQDSVVLSDGSMLLTPYDTGGYSVLLKLNADGTVDNTFGTNGYADNTVLSGGYIQSIEVQSDGKILVSGQGSGEVFLARYNANGTIDGGFGTSGITTLAAGADEATDIAIQADGSIVIVGEHGDDSFIARFTNTGILDAGFGSSGIVVVNLGGTFENLESVSILGDGSIIAVGETSVVKLDSSGTLDIGFDTDGILDLGNSAYGVAVQSDGKFVVTGGTGSGLFATRFNADGSIDTDFGTAGTVTWSTSAATGFAITQQVDGKLVVAGQTDAYPTQWVAVRFNTNGSIDTSFGTNGAWVQSTSTDFSEAYFVSTYDDGTSEKIVIGGYTTRDGFNDTSWVSMVRLNHDGSLDTSIGTNTLDGNPTFTEGGPAVVLDDDVRVFDAELSELNGGNGNFSGASITIARNGGANAEDRISVTDGNGITVSVFTSGGPFIYDLSKNGQDIANGSYNAGVFTLTFTDANGEIPTSADVDNILRQITYLNNSDTPPSSVQLDWIFDDGNTGAQGAGGALQTTGSTVVDITAVNDAPTLDMNTAASVSEGGAVILTSTQLNSSDVDDADTDFGYTVTSGPSNGQLELVTNPGVAISSFTEAQLQANQVVYIHNGSSTTSDSFDFTLADGGEDSAAATNGTFNVLVSDINDAPTFGGGDGVVITDDGGSEVGAQSVVQPDGKILVVGEQDNDYMVSRYNTDGTLDTSFGTNGIATFHINGNDEARAIALQSDGKIVVAGWTAGDHGLLRLNTDGSLDNTFGTGGIVVVSTSLSYNVQDVTIQPDGKILVAGNSWAGGAPTRTSH